jgi:hypothetical protein
MDGQDAGPADGAFASHLKVLLSVELTAIEVKLLRLYAI